MSVWIVEKMANGKVIPLQELVYCGECVNRSCGVCIFDAIRKEDDNFCKHGKRFNMEVTK